MRLFFVVVCALLIIGCESNERSPGPVQSDEGGALLVQATSVAAREIAERKTSTIQAATIAAAQTRDTQARVGTSTAQAIQQRQTEMALNATANAQALLVQATIQSATETSIARRAEATQTTVRLSQDAMETMQARAAQSAETATAERSFATATTYAATSTRSALELAFALERKQATATAEALDRKSEQARDDAIRSRQWNEYYDGLLKVLIGLGAITFLLMLIIQVARYLDVIANRQGIRLTETRSGTVLVTAWRGVFSAELIKPAPVIEGDADAYDSTQLPSVTEHAEDLIKVTTPKAGERFMTRQEPEAETNDQVEIHLVKRRLAMRLVRESQSFYASRGVDPASMHRIASWRDLNWASETWVRAVDSLKPYVIAKPGRAGGTVCGAEYPTLHELFAAIGERRITFGEKTTPCPTERSSEQAA